MNPLFISIETTNIPIREDIIKKYNLKKGMKTPFTGVRIVDINGDSTLEHKKINIEDTGVKENQTIFTQSETLG